jgi:PAS domain S-box-containing protein
MITTNREGTIVGWDSGAEALFGYARAQALGQPVDIVIPPAFREAHWAGFRTAMTTPTLRDRSADLPVLCADGVIRDFAGRLLVLSDAFGVAIGAMAIWTDAGTTGFRPFPEQQHPAM